MNSEGPSMRSPRADRDIFSIIDEVAQAAADSNYLSVDIEPVRRALIDKPECIHLHRAIDGNSPLHLGADFGLDTVVSLLLVSGADPCARNTANWTPLDLACWTHWGPVPTLIQSLLTHGAPAEDSTRLSPQPLDLLFMSHMRHEVRDAASLLLDAGAKPTLWAAVCLEDAALVDTALAREPAAWTPPGISRTRILRTALESLYAANESPNGLYILLRLLGSGFDPNEQDERGWNLFHYACTARCSVAVLDQLLVFMNSINSLTADGKTVIELCRLESSMEDRILDFLDLHGAR